MSNKVLITGSNGFLGSHIVEEAIKYNYNVFAGVRKSSNLQYLKDPKINFLYFSFEDEENLRKQLRSHKFEYIILNAGITHAEKKETYFKINAAYNRKLCKILIEENAIPRKLVLVSSLASYGPADYQVKQVLDKESTPHPVTWYGESKLQVEQFMDAFSMIPSIILRPTAVYGPRDYAMLDVYKAINMGLAPKVGFGKQDMTFIYVKDLAKLIISTLESRAVNKGYFVSDGEIYPSDIYYGKISKILNKKALKVTIPITMMKVIAGVSEIIGKIRGQYPILNRNKVKEYFARSFAVDTTDIKNDFNFVPEFTLEEGLKETINWCKTNKLL